MNQEILLARIKQTVLFLEPSAEVIRYGSRARGEGSPESDWDFLILLDGSVDARRKAALRRRLYELEWESGEVISPFIRSREEWMNPLLEASPFHERIAEEGVRL
jgi:predicted nucleotidyltransferase